MNVLVLGAEGSGKSLFIKRLHTLSINGFDSKFEDTPSTIPTVGNNITKINIFKFEVELREVGGAVAPLWKKYFSESDCMIFLIDKSNQFQYSASCMLLLMCLSNAWLENKRILILFNKVDFTCSMPMEQVSNIFRLNDIVKSEKHDIEVVECSCTEKRGFKQIHEWLKKSVHIFTANF